MNLLILIYLHQIANPNPLLTFSQRKQAVLDDLSKLSITKPIQDIAITTWINEVNSWINANQDIAKKKSFDECAQLAGLPTFSDLIKLLSK